MYFVKKLSPLLLFLNIVNSHILHAVVPMNGLRACLTILNAQETMKDIWAGKDSNIDPFTISRDKGHESLLKLRKELELIAQGRSATIFPSLYSTNEKLSRSQAAFLIERIDRTLKNERDSPWTEGGNLIELGQSIKPQTIIVGYDDKEVVDTFLKIANEKKDAMDKIPGPDTSSKPLMISSVTAFSSLATLAHMFPDRPIGLSMMALGMASIHPLYMVTKHIFDREGNAIRRSLDKNDSTSWAFASSYVEMRVDFYKKFLRDQLTEQDIREEESYWRNIMQSITTPQVETVHMEVDMFYRTSPKPEVVISMQTENPPSSMNGNKKEKREEEPEAIPLWGLPGLEPIPVPNR